MWYSLKNMYLSIPSAASDAHLIDNKKSFYIQL